MIQHVWAKGFFKPGQQVPQGLADTCDIDGQALHQNAKLRENQRIEQQQRNQRNRTKQCHQQKGANAARNTKPREARCQGVQKIGNGRGQHEGCQDALEHPKAE